MDSDKRVVLTGATGLIGRNLLKRLTNDGYQVVVFSRSPEKAREKLPGATDYVTWSVAESGDWFSAIDGAHAVVHLAGAPISEGITGKRWTDEHKAAIRDSRVIGTRGIVNAIDAASTKPAVFVCSSAIGYYGYHEDDVALTEDAPPGDDFLAKVCVEWEREASRATEFGVRTVQVRTGLLLDEDEGVLPQVMLPFKLRTGGPVMPGSQWYSWIHLADEINLYMLALEDERVEGPLNAVAPNPKTNREFTDKLGNVMNSPAWLPVPEFSLRLLLGEMADLVVKGQRVMPAKAQSLGYKFAFPMLEPALRDLLGKKG